MLAFIEFCFLVEESDGLLGSIGSLISSAASKWTSLGLSGRVHTQAEITKILNPSFSKILLR